MGTFLLIASFLTLMLIGYYAVTIWLDLRKMKNDKSNLDEETVETVPVSNEKTSNKRKVKTNPLDDFPDEETKKSPISDNTKNDFLNDSGISPAIIEDVDGGYMVGDTFHPNVTIESPVTASQFDQPEDPQKNKADIAIENIESQSEQIEVCYSYKMNKEELMESICNPQNSIIKKEAKIKEIPINERC